MTLADIRENIESLVAYAGHWNIIGAADRPWEVLGTRGRRQLVVDLFDRIARPCGSHTVLREAVRNSRFCHAVLIHLVVREPLLSDNSVCKVAAIYLSLYYSKVDGTFDIANFEPQYKQANSF